ncbi:MAG: DUF2911 domain-containing protein [Bacteroidota bacterium]
MRYSLFAQVLFLSFLITACNSTDQEAATDTVERQQFVASTEPLPEFTTTVVEAELASPRKEMSGVLDGVKITVNYGSPSVKGRSIWDSLVPYGEVWRTGANEATRFTVNKDITVGNAQLPAGTYGLFTIPDANGWQIIFNREADQWGSYEYDEEQDVIRVSSQPTTIADTSETLEFSLGRNAVIMEWETLRLPIPVTGS